MHRRIFLQQAAALLLATNAIALPDLARASVARFVSQRLAIGTRGNRRTKGRDIIFIPGLASGPGIWNPLLAGLEGNRFHLVHIDGFAGRPAGRNASGPLLSPLADELARYIATQNLRRPIIVGHSMGGTLALMLGLRANVQAEHIIVVDMLPDGSAMLGGTAQGYGYLAGQLNGYLTGTKAGRQILTDMVRQTPEGRNCDPQVIAQALTELAQMDLTPQLPRLRAPLTVVPALPGSAQLDAPQIRRYRSAYGSTPRLTIRPVGPSGHMVMQDQPQKLGDIIRSCLQ